MSADGPEQREADRIERLERAEHRLEEREQNADESRDSFSAMIFDVAKANMLASQAAFDAGYKAGYAEGANWALDKASAIITGSNKLGADLAADKESAK